MVDCGKSWNWYIKLLIVLLQPDTLQTAAGYESTSQETNVVRDLIHHHQQLFGVCLLGWLFVADKKPFSEL